MDISRLDDPTADFAPEVRYAIQALLDEGYYHTAELSIGPETRIIAQTGPCFDCTLTLIGCDGFPGDAEYICFEVGKLSRTDGGYILSCEACNDDKTVPVAVSFQDARADITLYQADDPLFDGTPWGRLEYIARGILDKTTLPGEHLNPHEQALCPLLADIYKLTFQEFLPEAYQAPELTQLKAYFSKYGYSELLPLVEKLESAFSNSKRRSRLSSKLLSKLNCQKYEALWRELYRLLTTAQAAYPTRTQVFCSRELLQETRKQIQTLMQSHGYAGSYPGFFKEGAIPGIRLAESYDTTYFIGPEKHVVYHIHCTENWADDHLRVDFLCGTQLLRKDEAPGDCFCCLFNAKGRRLYREYRGTDNLEQSVRIAVKKAELKRLSKEERKYDLDMPWCSLFFFLFIVMGGLFSVLFTLGMLAITVLITAVVAGFSAVPEMLTALPWLQIFAACWVLYGGAMGLVTVLAKRK